ncbi:LytTR family DNA-binding domain-containing protein [Thalassotalea sp. G2M2-11]|uniref:LytTR family DNA-binding domain-containing protein n=1 Tax=Thalassotalea sp. G2M2-11 TaxID=2787627 RepID=UPI0019D2281A|nr:LytTR family DNA-binding domain-containing protein [Thalassotalea sp. G2M2-11]
MAYLLFIAIYSVFYFNYVAKGDTQYLDHLLWWLKLSGIWYFTAPLSLLMLTLRMKKHSLLNNAIVIGAPMVLIAITLQLLFDFSYVKTDLTGYFVLFMPKQLAIFGAIYLYWYVKIYQKHIHNLQTHQQAPIKASDSQTAKTSPLVLIELEHLGRPFKLDVQTIYLIRSAGNYVEINSTEGQYLKRASLKQILTELPDHFYQCHRSNIVNLHCISAIQNQTSGNALAILNNHQQVAISKRCKSNIKEKLADYPISLSEY